MISQKEIENVKLLMVGAGGIGCELLKNLVLTGFKNIEIIDLDTIELSNLNRQFLFQKIHVGQSKALVAKQSAIRFNPNAQIVAHHDSIMNQKYNTEYFKQFTLVLNALDNKAARSHVNRLCLAADVPLIESGSAGYLGQVTVIKKGQTECYDCLPKPPAKTFPGCTIRNTPSEPIHCIVWAKHLFNQLFGSEDPDEAVSPDAEDPENMTDGLNEISEKKDDIVRVSTRQWAKQTNYDSKKLFNKLFNDDIRYLLSMAKLWQKRKAPEPLDYDLIINSTQETQTNGISLNSQRVWTLKECLDNFSLSIDALKKRLEKEEEGGILVWDKDDEDALNFVTAAANLRCNIFSIVMKSKFDVKSLAGNIIPAIATTNAIIAGLIVLQAIKIIRNLFNECKTVFLRDKPIQQKLIVPGDLVKPNPKCYVCASKPEIKVKLDVNKMTIKQFESKILKHELAIVAPDVEIDDGSGRIVISSEEGETEDNYDKTLSYFGLGNGSSLKCDDFVQNYELKIVLIQCDDLKDDKEYEMIADNELEQLVSQKQAEANEKSIQSSTTTLNESRKRSLSLDDHNVEHQNKKLKTVELHPKEDSNDVLIDDDIIIESNSKTSSNGSNTDEIVECLSNSNSRDSDIKEIKSSSDDDIVEVEEIAYKQKLITIVEGPASPVKKQKISNSNGHNTDDDIITL